MVKVVHLGNIWVMVGTLSISGMHHSGVNGAYFGYGCIDQLVFSGRSLEVDAG
jgi:hypothetical protein